MKFNLFTICCFIAILFFSSCNDKKKENSALVSIDIEANIDNMQKIYLSQFTDNVRYVPLESNSDHPLSWIILSDFSENHFLASDMKICFLYDNVGHYIRQIGKQGRGPGEYTGIASVFLIDKKVYIRDYLGDDLVEYKLDGTFLKRHKSGFTADEKYRLE